MVERQDRTDLIQFLKNKHRENCHTTFGTGPQISFTYIDSKFLHVNATNNERVELLSSDLYTNLIGDECNDSGSNVIIADSGLGKTSFALRICEKYWESIERRNNDIDRIPLYIYLPSVVSNLRENILEKSFESKRLLTLLRKYRLLLILDGFDELKDRSDVNIFEANGWSYPDIKIVILSRNTILKRDKITLFDCSPKPSNDHPSFVEYLVQPFDEHQINNYIVKVDSFLSSNPFDKLKDSAWGLVKCEYDDHNWNKDGYFEWLRRLPDLSELAKTPFLLSLILQTLPVIVRTASSESSSEPLFVVDAVKKFSATKVGVFDSFTENWFQYQYHRFNLKKFKEIHLTWPVFRTLCYAYAQNWAYTLINRDKTLPHNLGMLQENIRVGSHKVNDWHLLELPNYGHNKISSEHEVSWNYCLNLFKNTENLDILKAIQNSCLVRFVETPANDFRFQFVHRSIAEYFVSREIFVELQSEFEYYLQEAEARGSHHDPYDNNCVRGLNEYILKEVAVLHYLSERVSNQSDFSELLFKIIEQSKELSLIAIMSANSISILNIAGTSFSGRNFEWIQIPGANLNHSLCGNANFKGANLENVSFEDSWLAGAKLNGAKLTKTNFGLNPSFATKDQQTPISIKFYQNKSTEEWFVYSGHCDENSLTFKVIKWNVKRITKDLEFTAQDERRENFSNTCGFSFIDDDYLIMWSEKLRIFCAKTGSIVASILIPEIHLEPSTPFASIYIHQINVVGKKLFVSRHNWINEYQCYDVNPVNLKLNLTFNRDLGFGVDNHEFIANLGLIVVSDEKYEIIERTGEHISVRNTVDFYIISFAIDSIRLQIALGGYNGDLEIRQIESNVILKKFKLPCAGIEVLRFSTDCKYLAAAAHDNVNGHFIRIWETDHWNELNSIDVRTEIVNDFQFWSSHPAEVILGVAFASPQIGLQFFSILLHTSRMVTQQKMFPHYIEFISCSVDGTLIAAVLHKHRFTVERGQFVFGEKNILQVWSVANGRKICEFDFEFKEASLQPIHFVIDNKLLLIERTRLGLEYFYIYDAKNNDALWAKERTLIEYRKYCDVSDDFSSTGLIVNQSGTIFARGLLDGSICLFDLLPSDPYLRYKCHLKKCPTDPTSSKKYFIAHYIQFDPCGKYLVSSSNGESFENRKRAEKSTIRIWNTSTEQLLAEFSDDHFRFPHFYYHQGDCTEDRPQPGLIASSYTQIDLLQPLSEPICKKRFLFSFDSLLDYPKFDFLETSKLIALHAVPKHVQLWKVYQPRHRHRHRHRHRQLETKLLADIHLWFDIKFLKFIPLSNSCTPPDQCKILITGQSNVCCLQYRSVDHCLFIEWAHCSNLVLTVQDLCLSQCIDLNVSDHKELMARGAIGKTTAHEYQKYIAKSNIIAPILGSTLLDPDTVFNVIQSKGGLSPLNLSAFQWMLSAIEKNKKIINPYRRLVERHVFLVLEGIKHDRRFIFEAHLRYDKELDKVFFSIFPTTDIAEFREKFKDSSVRQWPVSADQGKALIADILNDYQNSLKYKFLTKNCVKWSKRKVKKLGFNFAKNPFDLIVVMPTAIMGRKMI